MLESQLESLAISGETLSNLCQAYKCENLLRAMPEKSKKNESSQHNEHLWCRNWYLRCFQANTIPVWRCSLRPGFIEEGDGAMAEPRKVQRLPPSFHSNSNSLFFRRTCLNTHQGELFQFSSGTQESPRKEIFLWNPNNKKYQEPNPKKRSESGR